MLQPHVAPDPVHSLRRHEILLRKSVQQPDHLGLLYAKLFYELTASIPPSYSHGIKDHALA